MGEKRCTKCQTVKAIAEFGQLKRYKDGLNPWCKQCNRDNANRHRLANLDAISAKRKAKYRANPEPVIRRVRDYARRNPEVVRQASRRYYQATREQRLAYMAEYYRKDPRRCLDISARAKAKKPDYYRLVNAATTATRRARLRNVQQIPFTTDQLAQRLAYYGNRCWMCNEPGTTVDHVKPIVAGGPNMLANLRPACGPCNSGKAGRWPYVPPLRTMT